MYKKEFNIKITVTDFHLLSVILAVIHLSLVQIFISLEIPEAPKKEVNSIAKVPIKLRSVLSKKTRSSRFTRYVKNLKEYDINDKISEETNAITGLTEDEGTALKDLTHEQINKILKEQKELLSKDIAQAKQIFQKNQRTYQACYENALLKDRFLSGVSNVVVSISNGKVNNVQTKFKGDGHKSALKVLNKCLKSKSIALKVNKIKGKHLINFNLIFKS